MSRSTTATIATLLTIAPLAEAAGKPAIHDHGKSGLGFMIDIRLCSVLGDARWLEYLDEGHD